MVNAQQWLDKEYPKKQRKNVKELDISCKNLQGNINLGDFTNLEKLWCNNNELADLNLNGLSELKEVYCFLNSLTDLKLIGTDKLRVLDAGMNKLRNLDFSSLSNSLEKLLLHENDFLSQNISCFSGLTNLSHLTINNDLNVGSKLFNRFYGSLKSFENLTKLERFDIRNTDIDFGLIYLPKSVKEFRCSCKERPESKVRKIIKEIETAKSFVYVEEGDMYKKREEIKKENVKDWLDKNYPNKDARVRVKTLDIGGKGFGGYLDLNDFENLKKLFCGGNQITGLDVEKCIKLETLKCENSSITNLQLPNKKNNLKELVIIYNKLPASNLNFLKEFVNLERLHINNNRFYGSLKYLKDCCKLKHLDISDTDIDSGLEYLPESIEIFRCLASKGSQCKVKVISSCLNEPWQGGWCDYQTWRKDRKKWEGKGFNSKEIESWMEVGLKMNESDLASYLINQGYQPTIPNVKEKIIRESWRNIIPSFDYPLRKNWEKRNFNWEEAKRWINAGVEPKDHEFIGWCKDIQKIDAGWVLNNKEEFHALKDRHNYFGTCKECNQPNVGRNWCRSCNIQHWQQNKWTSGNKEVDKFIQKYQLEATDSWNTLEWIPYEKFADIEYLAEGGFGTVYRAKWNEGPIRKWSNKQNKWKRNSKKEVALKSLNNSQNASTEFFQEISTHKLFKDKFTGVVPCYGISQDPQTKHYVMVMEHMKEGNLQQYLQKNCQKLSFSDKLNQLNDIAKGLKDIHQQKLIHCDFHSGNILYPPCSIADLGLCRSTNEENRGEKIFGVLPYVAPEVLQGKLYTQASDIYSFGMVAYEVLTGLTPYHNSSHDTDLVLLICKGGRPEFSIRIPHSLEDLIRRCWDDNPSKRPNANEISKSLGDWKSGKSTEFIRQIQAAEEFNEKLSEEVRHPDYIKPTNTRQISKQIYGTKDLDLEINFDLDELNLQETIQEKSSAKAQIEQLPK